jgi:tRNA-dihydrouridine synthase
LLSTYFRNLVETEWPDAIGKMKQFACWFTHGVRNGSELRRNVHTARTSAEILDRVDSFFADAVTADGSGLYAPSP